MSGALLKLANSSFYGGKPQGQLDRAGHRFPRINQVAALMTGLLARQAIVSDRASLAAFWDLSTRRAQAMVFLSRRLRIGAPDVAHTFGLFCDTGVALLLNRFDDYGATFEAASRRSARVHRHRGRAPQHQPRGDRLPAGAQLGLVERRRRGRSCTTTTTA